MRRPLPHSDAIPVAAPFWYGWKHVAKLREFAGAACLASPPDAR